MTEEQLAVARRHQEHHRKEFGHAISNVRFLHGYIERLQELELADSSVDIIASNCVLNLASDKAAVLREAWRVLKPGGELYFSDVYTDRRVPIALTTNSVPYGECLSGALYWNDFLPLCRTHGFAYPRLVDDRRRLWLICSLSRYDTASSSPACARQASSYRNRQAVSCLRQHLAHAARHPICHTFRFLWKLRAAPRYFCWLRDEVAL